MSKVVPRIVKAMHHTTDLDKIKEFLSDGELSRFDISDSYDYRFYYNGYFIVFTREDYLVIDDMGDARVIEGFEFESYYHIEGDPMAEPEEDEEENVFLEESQTFAAYEDIVQAIKWNGMNDYKILDFMNNNLREYLPPESNYNRERFNLLDSCGYFSRDKDRKLVLERYDCSYGFHRIIKVVMSKGDYAVKIGHKITVMEGPEFLSYYRTVNL